MGFRIKSARERPDLAHRLFELDRHWPEFYKGDPYSVRPLTQQFPQFQLLVIDEDNEVVAAARSVPIVCGGVENLPDGWDDAMASAGDPSKQCNALCAISIIVEPERRGGGVSKIALYGMQRAAREAGYTQLIAPVRPSLKERYPLTPFERYIEWRNEKGERFDPWVRVHEQAGARIAKVAPRSMEVTGTVKEWESWTGLQFPESGMYIVPGALEPVEIDLEKDWGVYREPNVWMIHDLTENES